MIDRDIFVTPGSDDAQGAPAQPPHEVGQQVEGSVVSPLQVVEKEEAGMRAATDRKQYPAYTLKEAASGTWCIQRRGGWQAREKGEEPG
jgi:hypothetical protein